MFIKLTSHDMYYPADQHPVWVNADLILTMTPVRDTTTVKDGAVTRILMSPGVHLLVKETGGEIVERLR